MLVLSRLDYARLRPLQNRHLRRADAQHPRGARRSGTRARGSQRAINFPFFSFQASELGKVLLIVALAALVVERARRLRERDTTVARDARRAGAGDVRDRPARPRLGHGLHGDRRTCCCSSRAPPGGTSRRSRRSCAVSLAFVLVAAPAAGVHVLKPYQVRTPDGVPAPDRRTRRSRATSSRSRRSRSARARRPAAAQRATQTANGLRAREPHRLRLRRRRRAVRLRRRRRSCCCSTRC